MTVPAIAKATGRALCCDTIQKPQATGQTEATLQTTGGDERMISGPANGEASSAKIAGASAAAQKNASHNGRIGSARPPNQFRKALPGIGCILDLECMMLCSEDRSIGWRNANEKNIGLRTWLRIGRFLARFQPQSSTSFGEHTRPRVSPSAPRRRVRQGRSEAFVPVQGAPLRRGAASYTRGACAPQRKV